MTEGWTTKAFSNNATPIELTDEMLNEEGVIFLTGKNIHNDQVYSYLKLTIANLQKLKAALKRGDQFMPSDFGTVLAAGKGEPPAELRSEMAVTYKLVDVPRGHESATPHSKAPSVPSAAPASAAQKQKMPTFAVKDIGNFWDE